MPHLNYHSMLPMPQDRCFWTLRRDRLTYAQGIALQESCLAERPGRQGDILILLEHTPVITHGRGASQNNLLASRPQLQQHGIELHLASRGGDMTYHGPGQIIGYPIVDLKPLDRDLHRYLRMLEEVLLDAVSSLGVKAVRLPGKTGIWVDGQKLASIGVGVRRWLSWHGFALNLTADLSGFEHIVPCGLPGVRMTSLEQLLNRPVSRDEMEKILVTAFARVFDSHYLGEYETQAAAQA